MTEMTDTQTFAKVLKTRDVVALSFGAMIGWSWVLMTGVWISEAGTLGTLIAFSVGGLAITLIGLTYSELAAAMPKAGGEHVYTHRALGPNWSFVCTWALLFSYLNVCMFESVALPTAIEYLFPEIRIGTLWSVLGSDVDVGFAIIGALGATLVTWTNYVGIKTAAFVQTIVTALILLSGALLISGVVAFGELDNSQPLLGNNVSGIVVVFIMVPAMLIGFDVIPQSAEEIDLPPNRIGRLLVISVFCAVLWYIGVSAAVGFGLPGQLLTESTMATADAAKHLWGNPNAGYFLVFGGVCGILTSWNAFVVGASRVLYALAESGFIPAAFGKLHPKYHTPYVGILTIGALSIIAPLFGRTILVWLINTSSFAVTIAFLFVAISFLALRKNEPEMPRPFQVSHPNLVGYGAIIMSLALLAGFFPWSDSALVWPDEWLTILAWVILGGLLLVQSRRKRQ